MISGTSLPHLKKKIEYHLRLLNHHANSICKTYLLIHQETVALLMAADAPNISESEIISLGCDNPLQISDQSSALYFLQTTQSFWLGHFDQCKYYTEKTTPRDHIKRGSINITLLYQGLSPFRFLRKANMSATIQIANNFMVSTVSAAKLFKWNYQPKVHLLDAEIFS